MRKIFCDKCGNEVESTSEYVDGLIVISESDSMDRSNLSGKIE